MVETLLLFFFVRAQTFRTLLAVVPKRDTSIQTTHGLALVFLLVSCGCICVGILPYMFHLFNISKFLSESCHNSCCTTSILHATLDLFLDCGFAITPVVLEQNASSIGPSLVPTMRRETAIEKQADEFAEKIDFSSCVPVFAHGIWQRRRPRSFLRVAVGGSPPSRSSWRTANRAASRMRRTMTSTANPLSIRRSIVNHPQQREKPNVLWAKTKKSFEGEATGGSQG